MEKSSRWATGFQGRRGGGDAPPPPKNETLATGLRRLMYLPTQDLCQQVDSHSSEVARSAGITWEKELGEEERGERVIV